MAEMARHLLEGTKHLSRAFDAIAAHAGKDDHLAATAAADDATKCARRTEKVYRQAMSDLLRLDAEGAPEYQRVRELMGRRELYRRLSRIADTLVAVADRVWYAAVKEL
jgi:phosphate uptake regulator